MENTRRYSMMIEGDVWRKYHGKYGSGLGAKELGLSDCKVLAKGVFFEFSFFCDRKKYENFLATIKKIQESIGLIFRSVDSLTTETDCGEAGFNEFQYVLIRLSSNEMLKITPDCCYLPDERIENGRTLINRCSRGDILQLGFESDNFLVEISSFGHVIQILGCEKVN